MFIQRGMHIELWAYGTKQIYIKWMSKLKYYHTTTTIKISGTTCSWLIRPGTAMHLSSLMCQWMFVMIKMYWLMWKWQYVVPCLIQSMHLLLCVLSVFMDLEPLEETLQEHAALPANLPLPLTTEPGCSGECKLLILIAPLIPHLVCHRCVPGECKDLEQ